MISYSTLGLLYFYCLLLVNVPSLIRVFLSHDSTILVLYVDLFLSKIAWVPLFSSLWPPLLPDDSLPPQQFELKPSIPVEGGRFCGGHRMPNMPALLNLSKTKHRQRYSRSSQGQIRHEEKKYRQRQRIHKVTISGGLDWKNVVFSERNNRLFQVSTRPCRSRSRM